MKFIVLLSCLAVVFVYADQQAQKSIDEIADEEFVLDQEPDIRVLDDGSFVLSLVDKDGSKYEEEGLVLTDEKTGEEVVIPKKGTFSYPSGDGEVVQVAYDVDEPVEEKPTTSR